ncbi:hypothetical protein POM88_007589 [Heracleum sosnowskyi]|uniref:Transposase-associated domain-containing protein n=1 Tax=Heracleum sosnowskyi TaxID=360622 RepID=A0AAD8N6L2_9APIA|nr:hypothetical protein POM88_007589 [Heracleum sosnowskyi]
MDRHTWMYKISRATQEYIDGVEKFIQCAEENLKKKREHGKEDRITCPCHDCYNLKKYSSVATIREHLFRRGFMASYTNWIWHGEGIHSEKTRTSDGNRGSNEDSMPTNKEDDVVNDKINEMIEDVEDLLVHQPKILENLVDDSKKLLYPGCNNVFTSKVIDPMTLDKLQADIIETLCEFEIFLYYLASVDPVGIPRSRHKGRLEGQESPTTISNTLKWLAYGPDIPVTSYEGYDEDRTE